jgi:uncharacterized protein YjbI with pentapeptide repeats
MPLCSSFTRSPLWDKAIWNAFAAIGNPGESILAVIAAKRVSDKASYGIFCSDQAIYLLRSEFACERIPWENVAVFAPGFNINQAIELVLGKTTHSQRAAKGEIETVRHAFQVSQNQNRDLEMFFTVTRQKMSEMIVHSEQIEVLPNTRPRFQWRIFSGTIQLIQLTDIPIDNPSQDEKAQMNAVLRNRINELVPRFAEIEQTYIFNEDGWRTWGDPASEIDPGQLVAGANLQNADLSGEDFSFKDLMNVNFENADLSNCNLQFAFLFGANLKNANLANCDLSGAILQGCNLEGANLSNCNLTWATINNANLKDADLSGSDLRSALLSDAVLVNANMTKSKMGYLALDRQIRKGRKKANYALASADSLKGTFLVGADLSFANLFGADLDAPNCYFKDPSGRSATFNGTVMPEGYKFD